MKKEIVAAALLLTLIAGGLYNTHYLHEFTDGLTGSLALSRAYCENGEYALALEHAQKAESDWKANELYAGIFLRHTEIDAVSDLFYELLGALAGSEPDSARAAYAPLTAHVENLYAMERVGLWSVF